MIKTLNQRIQKHYAFFGPKWFCWLMVFMGFQTWIVEGTFKALASKYLLTKALAKPYIVIVF